MVNEYTIYFPKKLNRSSALYGSIKVANIDAFNFTTSPSVECQDSIKDGGLWQLTVNSSRVVIYLDRESYIITPEGVKFEFSEFRHFAKYIANRNLERYIEVLE